MSVLLGPVTHNTVRVSSVSVRPQTALCRYLNNSDHETHNLPPHTLSLLIIVTVSLRLTSQDDQLVTRMISSSQVVGDEGRTVHDMLHGS